MKLIFIAFFVLILYISFNNTILNPYLFEGADKLKHFFAFCILSFLFYLTFKELNYKFFILTSFAIALELIQSFTQRESSLLDFLASFTGIIFFYFILSILKKVTRN